jgi:hypothetical protein
MRYQLHSVVKRAVTLDVDVLLVSVGDSKKLVSVVRVFACSVNFKLYAEISVRIAIEDRPRLISVVVDASVLINFVVVAVTAVIVTVKVIGIILMEQSITAAAASIVVVIAVGAERGVLSSLHITEPQRSQVVVWFS